MGTNTDFFITSKVTKEKESIRIMGSWIVKTDVNGTDNDEKYSGLYEN
jgi:hypothetical protein